VKDGNGNHCKRNQDQSVRMSALEGGCFAEESCIASHPSHKNKGVARVGHPAGGKARFPVQFMKGA
jgi:hypothetical protein